jgi:hypothetical protein
MRNINSKLMRLALILFAIPCRLLGQSDTNAIDVWVIDPSGAGIPQAQIRVEPPPENSPEKAKTNDEGHAILSLKAGEYTLSISAQGFRTATQPLKLSNRDASNAAHQTVKVTLEVGHYSGVEVSHPTDSLVLSDADHSPIVLSLADFHALPHITIKAHNGHTNTEETYSGVLVESLLAKANAPVGKEFRKEALKRYLLASGTDGYSVVLSLAEVDSGFHAGQVIVADERDGQPLGKYGPFQLIVPGDTRPARWVHNLNAIRVQQAQ